MGLNKPGKRKRKRKRGPQQAHCKKRKEKVLGKWRIHEPKEKRLVEKNWAKESPKGVGKETHKTKMGQGRPQENIEASKK